MSDRKEITPEFAKRLIAPRKPAGVGPWCSTCYITMKDVGPGCPWSDCPHKTAWWRPPRNDFFSWATYWWPVWFIGGVLAVSWLLRL
jgi:hypothetical protein